MTMDAVFHWTVPPRILYTVHCACKPSFYKYSRTSLLLYFYSLSTLTGVDKACWGNEMRKSLQQHGHGQTWRKWVIWLLSSSCLQNKTRESEMGKKVLTIDWICTLRIGLTFHFKKYQPHNGLWVSHPVTLSLSSQEIYHTLCMYVSNVECLYSRMWQNHP